MDQQPNTDPTQHAAAEAMRRLPQAERELRETQATLEREREAHGRSASAVAHHREASVLKLSIGGTRFTTSRSTLVPASGFFSAYLSGRIPRSTMRAPSSWTAKRSIFQKFSPSSATARCHGGAATRSGRRSSARRISTRSRRSCASWDPWQNVVFAGGPTNERMRDENELRALFVSARDDPRISHPHTRSRLEAFHSVDTSERPSSCRHLIDVFSSTTFVGGGAELDRLRDVPTLSRASTLTAAPAAGAPSSSPASTSSAGSFPLPGGCSRV